MSQFYWSLTCTVHGELDGFAHAALVTTSPTAPAFVCPISGGDTLVNGSLARIATTNPSFSKVSVLRQIVGRSLLSTTSYVSEALGAGDFMFDPDLFPFDTKLRLWASCRRELLSTVTSAQARVVRVESDDDDGAAVTDAELSITFSGDNIQTAVSPDFVPDSGLQTYRIQRKKTGGLAPETVSFLNYGILVVTC